MAFDFVRLTEDLESSDPDILSLALGTLTRTPIKDNKLGREAVLKLYGNLLEHCNHPDSDLAFLARKAREHLYAQIPWLKSRREMEEAFKPEELVSTDFEKRTGAITALLSKNQTEALRILIWHYQRERNPRVLASMSLGLSGLENHKVVRFLEVFLYAEEDRLRANTVEAIDKLGSREEIITLLPPLLSDPNNRVRANALKAVGRFKPKEILGHLEQMTASPEVARRASALYVLDNMQGDGVIRLLSIAANDPFVDNRLKVIDILLKHQDKEGDIVLKRLAQDEDVEVSEKALKALRDKNSGQNQDYELVDISKLSSKIQAPTDSTQPVISIADLPTIRAQALSLDQKIDQEMLLLGQNVRKSVKAGLYKTGGTEAILSFVHTAEKLESQLNEFEEQKATGVKQKLFLSFGIGVQNELLGYELKGKFEDAQIEIGYETVRLALKDGIIFTGLMDKIKRAEELFLQRQNLEEKIQMITHEDPNP